MWRTQKVFTTAFKKSWLASARVECAMPKALKWSAPQGFDSWAAQTWWFDVCDDGGFEGALKRIAHGGLKMGGWLDDLGRRGADMAKDAMFTPLTGARNHQLLATFRNSDLRP